MVFENLMESWEEEAARVKAEGLLRKGELPVTIFEPELKGIVIELSYPDYNDSSITVVSTGDFSKSENRKLADGRYKRNTEYHNVIVLKSNMDSYPVGGYNLSVWEGDLRRGSRIEL